MRKAIFNLFIVLIICITALGMPLNLELPALSFDLSTQNDQLSYKSFIDSPLNNPTLIDFQIETKNPEKLSIDALASSFILEIIKETEIISTVDASKIITPSSTEKDSIRYTLNLSKENLNLSDDNYLLKLYSTAEVLKDIEPLKIEVQYTTLSKYIPATDTFPLGMMNLTLYYPDTKNEYLVPITKFVKQNRTPLGTIVNNLHSGSNILGSVSPIPDRIKLRVQKNRVLVFLPKDLGKYNTDPRIGTFALESFVNSFTSIKGIDQVKFFVNGKESDNLFYSYRTKDIYYKNTQPKVYLGMDTNQTRILLVPIKVENSSEKPLVERILHGLKTCKINENTCNNLVSPIPKNIELIDYTQNNNILTLNFNKEFLYAYQSRIDLQKMMLDAILYSFTSVTGIEKVQILVDGQAVNTFGEINLSQPISKPKFINPEKE
ncbi:GerMN domain-containing protein [Crassaminicella profunda]|uniref:GerMN domain-containing protein n=1 Tax=Crassaminicella profunda TaxID=1286698 RepID=UPI001CA7356F|nr:GerMN domain-containing protein [Crassaminicella profunda]QZY56048.1 GerMN domain-containing protein [Crassaminicella profunda]